jgi:hypothetical protein
MKNFLQNTQQGIQPARSPDCDFRGTAYYRRTNRGIELFKSLDHVAPPYLASARKALAKMLQGVPLEAVRCGGGARLGRE